MSVVSRLLGTAAAFAVVGVGAAALAHLLKKQQEELDAKRANEEEDALEKAAEEMDAQDLADAAALDAPGTVTAEDIRRAIEEAEAPKGEQKPPVEPLAQEENSMPAAEPLAPETEQKPPVEPLAGYTPRPDEGPNSNPVLGEAQEAGHRPDGSIDPEKICSPDDFSDWEDLGCQG